MNAPRPIPVVRPNDQPDPDRFERSARRLAMLERPQPVMPAQNERMVLALGALVASGGPMNNKALSTASGLRPGNTADLMTTAVAEGWVTKERVTGTAYTEVLIRITAEGRAVVAEDQARAA